MDNSDTTRTERIAARCSEKEKTAIEEAAKASKRTFSDYVRLVMNLAVKEEKKV